ncbi:MAG TPA: M28 family peptidase [Candidatus Eisenbacteria bacterium]
MRRILAAALSIPALLGAISCGPEPAARWWSDVRWLADDAREGRGTGTPGYLAAARYVAYRFREAGAKPAGDDGYFQPVRFVRRQIREPECLLALVQDGRVRLLTLGDDAYFRVEADAPESLEADAVFVGYGLVVPEYGYDDLRGLDLRGRIAVCLRGGPSLLPDDVRAHAMSGGERWRRLHDAGAIGYALVSNPRRGGFPWARARLARLSPAFSLADTALDENHGRRFGLSMNPARAERFFAGSGHTFAEILDRDMRGEPLPRFPLAARIRARVIVDRREVTCPNVVGIIEGGDSTLRRQAVVLSAHLDHLGIGAPVRGDSIYNGAMDNASGVATLIEIARGLGAPGHRPRRSVVLLAVTGEEEGLLGSRAFAARPTIGDREIVADVNLDMFLPIVPLRSLIDYGGDQSDLGAWFRATAESSGVRIAPDPDPRRAYFVRSDQYSFVRAGVPSVFVEFGPTGNPFLDRRVERWNRERYHAPSDDARQPVDFGAAAEFNRIFLAFARDVADRAERPRWRADSFFRKFAGGGAALASSRPARPARPAKAGAR